VDFNEYQGAAQKTAVYPSEEGVEYTALGLASEAGEVAGVVKKFIRGDQPSDTTVELLFKELGDVLWYVSQIASEWELDLDEIAIANIEKLRSRKKRGVLKGSGDNR